MAEMFWVKARITPECKRECEFDDYQILNFLKDSSPQYVITREFAPKSRKEHWHIVAHMHKKFIQEMRDRLKSGYTSRGWMCKEYTEKELISRSPKYYIGYTLKDEDCEVLGYELQYDLSVYRDHYYNEKNSVSDTYLNFMKERITEYDEEKILDSILDYYQHVKTGYDKKSVNKLFHLVRGHLFPERERAWVRQNKMLLIE